MHVHPSEPSPGEFATFKQGQGFVVLGYHCGGQQAEMIQDLVPIGEASAGDLADHEGVGEHGTVVERAHERRDAAPEVLNPHGRVHEDHVSATSERHWSW